MDLQTLKENRSLQITAVIIVSYIVIAVSFYFLAIRPKLSTISQISKDIKQKESALGKDVGYAEQEKKQREWVERVKKRISELKSKIDYYEKMLPVEKDIPYLLQYLSQVARETEVKMIQIEKLAEIESGEGQTLYLTVPVVITLKGGYHNLGLFINKLENAERFMKIETISVSSDKESPLAHKAYLLVCTYMLGKERLEERLQEGLEEDEDF